ncbi:GTPase of the mitochondrial inner membrane that associates with the large ribosomal subunit [Myotisia sp. PD_48]|nr:GTPase of the mitochondrial inner membrane that associates with the large ribosomal subunit [Myotisia sp. PD_48]
MAHINGTLMPFLYPCLSRRAKLTVSSASIRFFFGTRLSFNLHRESSTSTSSEKLNSLYETAGNRLDPSPSDYGRAIFQDRCILTLYAGSGGNGCVSFLREKYIEEGPANGGDGGTGGNILIQAVEGQTSLHKLARRGVVKAGRGTNGKGKSQGGQRGEDVLLQVPVGTVVREISRLDPVAEKELELKTLSREMGKSKALQHLSSQRDNWVLHPNSQPSDFFAIQLPNLGPPRRPDIAAAQPSAPIYMDLSRPMDHPILLAAGAVGGLGNPHFMSNSFVKPLFATKGERGMKLELEFELKLLADVGLVGLPNAGKSTLLRSLTNSRTRVGNWAFTTLTPNIGTVVLDNHSKRPAYLSTPGASPRQRFTIADIPGLIEDAHMDKGLGHGFLRHTERAGILAFVIDLTAGDAVVALRGLWRELNEYQQIRDRELSFDTASGFAPWNPTTDDPDEPKLTEWTGDGHTSTNASDPLPLAATVNPHSVFYKPWFVIGTKADLPDTKENFLALRNYLAEVETGAVEHPSGHKDAWRDRLFSIPVSAIGAEGVNIIPERIVQLMDGLY